MRENLEAWRIKAPTDRPSEQIVAVHKGARLAKIKDLGRKGDLNLYKLIFRPEKHR